MSRFSKDELYFVNKLPEQVEIECPVCLNILANPHLVSCCGHNFCESCIERVKASNGACPMCKEREFQAMVNKERLRIINGLQVYCTNRSRGCQWKRELKNLSIHLNKGEREGECQHEEVKCKHKCGGIGQRRHLKHHEDNECLQRPFECQYCNTRGTYHSITEEHYKICTWYPVLCPNQCILTQMPRGSVTDHVNNECPLQPVDCVFSWAGCKERPLRKDIELHTTDTKHMMILAVACGELKKEIKEVKDENEKLKVELGEKDAHIHSLYSATKLELQTLPIIMSLSSPIQVLFNFPGFSAQSAAIHFYTSNHGNHFSARLFQISSKMYLALAFHPGIFDRMNKQMQVPQIFVKYHDDQGIPLIKDFNKLVQCDVYTLENIRPADILSAPASVLTQEIKSHIFVQPLTVTLFMK